MVAAKDEAKPPRRGLSGLQLGLLTLLALLFLGSLALRWSAGDRSGAQGSPTGASGLVQGGAEPTPAEATPLERALPYVTESSLFGLIGFALGYAARKFIKLALLGLALFFVGLQALSWAGVVTIDWGVLVTQWNAWLFDLKENESLSAFLTRRVPSGGGLLFGFWLGFARG